jgi:AraC-like DNA-binding protein
MYQLQLFFIICNTGLLLLLAIILIKGHHENPSAILGAVLSLCAAGMGMFAVVLEWGWTALEIPLNLLIASSPLAFWLLAKSLFEETFCWKWTYLLLYAVCVIAGIAGHYITFGDFRGMTHWFQRSEVMHDAIGLLPLLTISSLFIVLAVYVALKDWRVDLVESRRRARMGSVLIAGIVILVITVVEFTGLGTPRSQMAETFQSGIFFILILGICVHYLDFGQQQPRQPAESPFRSQTPEEVDAQEGAHGVVIIDELHRLMIEERVYREEGLTIRRLAEKLDIREYQLRRLINSHLGFRNFNSFLNTYRIEEVSRQLVAPETRHLPVLSIALDMGYGSLSPFNKAFKEIIGMTPTEYRARHKVKGRAEREHEKTLKN